jgi:hypothetical protein
VRRARGPVLATLALCLGTAAFADDGGPLVEVPSGQPVHFLEVVRDARGTAGLTFRFRFVAPEIARAEGSVDFETAAADMDHLCNSFALDRIADIGPKPAQIVISLADSATAFGDLTPEVTKFFEAYRVEDGACIWEGF